jgi:glycosyltransferase involved in cell wall biosynthesis
VFIHREASPLGPPIFEWILTKVWRKKVVFDFDDAIWIPNTSQENKLAASLKAFWKIPKICKWVDTVAGGNDYLCNFAREQGAKNVLYLPTVVNTTNKYNQIKQHEEKAQVAIGWTGSHSTLKYLDALIPVLQQVESETNAQFIVIADKKPDLPLKNLVFVPWNEQTEIEDLLKIDIGLMPLTSDQWSEGKCGFKLIQYLSVGIPAIASPVGVNTRIIEEGKNGYICTNNKEWASAIKSLIADATARQKMGVYGREKMVKEYSIDYAAPVFLESLMKKNT